MNRYSPVTDRPWRFGDAAPEAAPACARGPYATAPAYADAPGMAGEVFHLGPRVGETIGQYEVRVRGLPPGALRPEWRLPERTRLSLLARLSVWTGRAWTAIFERAEALLPPDAPTGTDAAFGDADL